MPCSLMSIVDAGLPSEAADMNRTWPPFTRIGHSPNSEVRMQLLVCPHIPHAHLPCHPRTAQHVRTTSCDVHGKESRALSPSRPAVTMWRPGRSISNDMMGAEKPHPQRHRKQVSDRHGAQAANNTFVREHFDKRRGHVGGPHCDVACKLESETDERPEQHYRWSGPGR